MSTPSTVALEDVLPLTSVQEAIVYHSSTAAAQGVPDPYLIVADLPLEGLEVEHVTGAVASVVARHAALRTSYTRRRTGAPVARVHSSVEIDCGHTDLGELTELAYRDSLTRLRESARRRPFVLTSPGQSRWQVITAVVDRRAVMTLMMTVHHVALDGWSIHRVFDEVLTLARGGTPAPAIALNTWYRHRESSDDGLTQWTDELAGLSEPSLLAASELPHAPASTTSTLIARSCGADLSQALRDLARSARSTTATVMQTAWALVLAERLDRDDVVFGTVVSGRDPELVGVDEIVGMLVNTIPVRHRIDPRQTITETLREAQRRALALTAVHHTGLGDIQSAVGLGELFDSLVVVESFPRGAVRPHILDENTYPATLIVEDDPDIGLLVEYRDPLGPTLLDDLMRCLQTMVAQAEQPLGGWPRVTTGGYAPARAHGRAYTDADLVEPSEQIRRVLAAEPRALTLACGEDRLTAAELDVRSAQIAHALIAGGAGSESVVALHMPRGIEAVVALLGILRCGAAYLPIDPAHPAARIDFMLADAGVTEILDAARFTELSTATIDPGVHVIDTARNPDRAAYLIYTSGSTGTPKGVVGTARALATRIAWAADSWDGSPVLAKSSFAFIDGTTEILGALAAGSAVVIADDTTAKDASSLAALSVSAGVRQITAVPSLASAITEVFEASGSTSVPRRWIVSGEPLAPPVADTLRRRGAELINSYGSSEVAGDVSTGVQATERVDVGTPVPGTGLKVLDRFLRVAEVGVPGELYVTGMQVGRGYHRRADLTATRFVADPDAPGTRMYCTGDRAVIDADRRVHLLGRTDSQVKIRGQRVELGEVEAALMSLSGIDEAVVVAGTDPAGDIRLDAYVQTDLDHAQARELLADTLPAHMIPATWTALGEIPRTPGGKVDRRGLPAPRIKVSDVRHEPTTDTERLVVSAAAEVLGLRSADEIPGPDADFLDLGGHSLSATRLITRLRVATGVALTVADVFEHRRLADLAALLEVAVGKESRRNDTTGQEPSSDEPVALSPRPDPLPLSPAQQRLYFQSTIDDSAYTVPFVVRLDAPIDPDRLEAALQGVCARHEVLRTRIVEGTPVIDADPVVSLSLNEGPASQSLLAELICEGFDLAVQHPIRAHLIGPEESDDNGQTLLIAVHHIAADEWSARTLFDELADGYVGRPVTAPTVQYTDHAVWHIDRLGDPAVSGSLAHRQLTHWRSTLSGAPEELALPYDRARRDERDHSGAEIRRRLDGDRLHALRSRARDEGASMFMLAHSAVALTLSCSGAGNDIIVGTPIAGRSAAAAADLIGMFVNTLALRTDFGGNPTLREAIGRVRKADLEAYAHSDIGFDAVVTAVAPARSLGRHPIFQTMVQYRDPIVVPDFGDVAGTAIFPATVTSKFDLTFEFLEDSDGLTLRVEYATELFDAPTVDALTDRVLRLLDILVTDPERRVAEVNLGAHSRATTAPAPAPSTVGSRRTLIDVFVDIAARFPQRRALLDSTTTLTYRALEERTAKLACALIDRGVRPGDRVALSLSRGVPQIVAVLATLRAGASYVPIDPDYPAERIDVIVTDSTPSLVIDDAVFTDLENSPSASTPEHDSRRLEGVAELLPASSWAYVIFTSGSTGRPKGVTVSHANVIALLDSTADLFEFGPDDVWTLFHSYAFDFSVWEMWGALSTGAALVVPDRETVRSTPDFAALLAGEGVTVLNQTPTAFFALDAHLAEIATATDDLASLRYVVFGGEALDLPRLHGFHERHRQVRTINMYGITETTVHASHLEVTPEHARTAAGSDVGAWLPGFDGVLLDQYLRPVPDGVVGEAYLAGSAVTSGYLHRPDLTATRFVADPTGHGRVLYRTGDLFRRLPDGAVHYAGRADSQVKIRGFRIELGEVRSAVAALPGVEDVAVIARPAPSGGDRLLAYVVGPALDPESLRAAVAGSLPEHMVPSIFTVIDAVPRTVNGKVDAEALPDPEVAANGRTPSGEMEVALAEIFAESLGLIDPDTGALQVGADDDFFAIGGDSIVSTTMVNRARRRGIVLTPRDVFAHRTVAGLATVAAWADTADRNDATHAISGTEVPTAEGPVAVPLMPVMHRLREFGGTIDRFNQSLVIDTPAGIDAERISELLQSVIDSHESLRMTLQVVAGTVWSLQAAPAGRTRAIDLLETVEITAHGDIVETVRIESDRAAGRLAPADGRMLSATFLRPESGQPGRLILVIHHLAVDGVSRRIILDDLAAADEMYPQSPTTALEAMSTITCGEYAQIVTERAADPALLGEVEHWAKVLAPGAELVPGAAPAGGVVGDQRRHVITLEPGPTASLLTFVPERLGVGVTAVFLGALHAALSRVCDTADVIIDTERHGRDTEAAGLPEVDLSHSVGWFTTVSPLRLTPADTVLDAVTGAHREWESTPAAGIGFGMLRHLNPQMSAALATLSRPSVLLNYLGRLTVGGGAPWQPSAESTALAAYPDPDLGCGYPLEVDIVCRDEPQGPVLSVTFAHLPEQISAETTTQIADAFIEALHDLLAQTPD